MSKILETARQVFADESAAIVQMGEHLDTSFERAVELILNCNGRVVVTGVGKSGAIGRKIASTFASTGTPALFLQASEGLHGDLGMVAPGDVLVGLSYSGRTDDLLTILPVVKSMGVPVIALTGNARSFLADHADAVLDVSVSREACTLNLAPTSSTTATLAMGDALAICVMNQRQFTSEDFARFHPGGTLGRGLTLHVGDLMRTGARLAVLTENISVRDTMRAITEAVTGAAIIVDTDGKLSGYLTDGDVRRLLVHSPNADELLRQKVAQIMTRSPLAFSPDQLALEAMRSLQERGVDDAPVVDGNNVPVGLLDVQELLRAGLM
ncbi:MAG: KpsF/GutQ family sugar-phosphate isomerase [Abditibacteriaceae bacterium]